MGELPDAQARLIDEATAAVGSASLSDIQHVVIPMHAMPSQETSPKRPPVP